MRRLLVALALASLASGAAHAHDVAAGTLEIGHPHAFETSASAMTAAGYLTITNKGTTPDRLIAVETGFPRTEIHTVEVDAAGVSRMRPVEGIEVPPGGTVALEPQGMHVMFMGLKAPLVAGQAIPATLRFEAAGAVPVEFTVEPRRADGTAH
ncbi:copper chaperone PCu(A)C [Amaricoccus sp.]|uniref:copper chaperone PCu(A)C n=1 Tax=Amaricoccus sp. TaxID=1872485 RepID=UPI002625A32F|nr:copper chaperone PCu(A)C [Amaricoccus sp.]HRO12157.1 copper chaperone PCu(A)C [Amaricoccus sp.]